MKEPPRDWGAPAVPDCKNQMFVVRPLEAEVRSFAEPKIQTSALTDELRTFDADSYARGIRDLNS